MAFNRFANRRFNTDIMLHGVTANAGNQLVGLALVIILKIKLHSIVQPHLIVLRTVRDHLRRLQHPLQIANPALVRVLVLLGGVIFKILTEVSVRPRLFYRFQRFLPHHKLAVLDLFSYLLDIMFR